MLQRLAQQIDHVLPVRESGEVRCRHVALVAQRDVRALLQQQPDHGFAAVLGGQHQRRAAVRRRGIDIGAFLQQQLDDVQRLRRIGGGRVMQRRPALAIHIGTALDQLAHDVEVTLDAGHHQRRLVLARSQIDIDARRLEQHVENLERVLMQGRNQPRPPARIQGVGIEAAKDQIHHGTGVVADQRPRIVLVIIGSCQSWQACHPDDSSTGPAQALAAVQ